MKILFVTGTYKPAYIYGGPTVVIALLAESLVKLGHSVTVYTTTANGANELDVEVGKEVMVDGIPVIYFKRNTKDHTHVSFPLWSYLNRHVREFDVVHIHSWWNFLAVGAAYVCRRNKVTPILSPHGMFSNYIMETNNSLPKKILHRIIGKKLLAETVLHVSTVLEWNESQHIIPSWKGRIIPNLVILSEALHVKPHNDIFTIGFLSRIDPKKGLDYLIKALAKVNFDFQLLVAGSGEEEYIKSLKQLAANLKIDKQIQWLGWKNGEDKFDFLAQLNLFALTSHSENFAIVVIESLSVGTPVMISDKVGLFNYVNEQEMGWVTTMDIDNIAESLMQIHSQKDKLESITEKAPAIIQHEYDATVLTKKYVELYKDFKQN